jgi:predicted RNase H-like nuclease (RuvC/YqgF family)
MSEYLTNDEIEVLMTAFDSEEDSGVSKDYAAVLGEQQAMVERLTEEVYELMHRVRRQETILRMLKNVVVVSRRRGGPGRRFHGKQYLQICRENRLKF